MLGHVIRRVLMFALTLWVIVTLSFAILAAVPGNPFQSERGADAAVLAKKLADYGITDDWFANYTNYLGRLLGSGDLGPSLIHQGEDVGDILASTLPVSLALGIAALDLALVLGVLLGIFAAVRQNSWVDYTTMSIALIGISIPNFTIAAALLGLFAIALSWLPISGWGDAAHFVLPAVCLALPFAARIARLTRAGMLDVLGSDFVRTARAKGCGSFRVIGHHCLVHAVLPVVSYLGPATAGILTGSLVIERIFAIPGVGRMFVDSALNRDYFLILGTIEVYSLLLVSFILLSDLAYTVLDPRLNPARAAAS